MRQNKENTIRRKILFIASLLFVTIEGSFAVDRFPRPEFQSDYQFPNVQAPVARSTVLEYVDVAVLILSLSVASYLVVKAKTRKGLFPLSVFAILYFGFYRKGCVCAIGSIQNIAYALFANDYAIPLTVILFFAIPIVFTLLFGRTFCSHVCPFGGLQDLVHMKTLHLPQWISLPLGIVPYVYLGLSILLAATGSTFVICRFDPFVNLFRFSGDMSMIVFGVVVLSISLFVARPYCRFLCPYGAILKLMSYFSWKHVEIAEGECSKCGACHRACRYQSIRTPGNLQTDESPAIRKRHLSVLLVIIPLVIASGGFAGRMMSIPLSRINPQVTLADELAHPNAVAPGALSLEAEAFKTTGTSEDELFAEVKTIKDSFDTGGIVLGLFVGIVFSITLIGLTAKKKNERYKPDRLLCFSCGRCVDACPKEKRKR